MFKEVKENNMLRREMDIEKTHIRCLAMNSDLRKCRISVDEGKKNTLRVFTALVLLVYPRQ